MTDIFPKVFVIGFGDNPRAEAAKIISQFRHIVFQKYKSLNTRSVPQIEIALTSNLKKEISRANSNKSSHVVIMKNETDVIIKDMKIGEQRETKADYLGDEFSEIMEAYL